jgi:hypothetical protein
MCGAIKAQHHRRATSSGQAIVMNSRIASHVFAASVLACGTLSSGISRMSPGDLPRILRLRMLPRTTTTPRLSR